MTELAAALAISDRQLRRDHRRALAALAGRLWEQLFAETEADAGGDEAAPEIEIHLDRVDLRDVLAGVQKVMQGRVAETGIPLLVEETGAPVLVTADRVILRQMLISLFSTVLQAAGSAVQVRLAGTGSRVDVLLQFLSTDEELSLEMVRGWAERMGGQLVVEGLPERQAGIQLSLPAAEQHVILVVDDQAPAVNMFQRYLSRTPYRVIGVTSPDQALSAARRHHPVLILLDVMMPQVDGWEILQSMKLDEDLKHIPVIVCSAWEEPEMARSLGALRLLKKPITQKDLLDALTLAGLQLR